MAKKLNSDTESHWNILSVWLASYLFNKRKTLGVSVEDISLSLKISSQYFRMIESATTNVSPTRAFDIMTALESLGVESNFTSITNILVAIQLVAGKTGVELISTINKIRGTSAGMKKLLDALEPVQYTLVAQTGDDLWNSFTNEKLLVFENYLKNPFPDQEGFQSFQAAFNSAFGQTGSIWNGFLFSELKSLKESFKKMDSYASHHSVVSWEKEQEGEMMRISGIISYFQTLSDYVETFKWDTYIKSKTKVDCFIVNNYSDEGVQQLYKTIANSGGLSVNEVSEYIQIRKFDSTSIEPVIRVLNFEMERFKKRGDLEKMERITRAAKFDCWLYHLFPPGEEIDYYVGFFFSATDRSTDLAKPQERDLSIEHQTYRYRTITNKSVAELSELVKNQDGRK